MRPRSVLLLSATMALGSVAFAQANKDKKDTPTTVVEKNTQVILEIFHAIEKRDPQRFRELMQPGVEFHWPPSLPYGRTTQGANDASPSWGEVWGSLQPTEAERRMDPRVVAAKGDEVVVVWRQRGVSAAGERFEGEVLGLYNLREGKLARAQMFYFDPAAVSAFLERAQAARAPSRP